MSEIRDFINETTSGLIESYKTMIAQLKRVIEQDINEDILIDDQNKLKSIIEAKNKAAETIGVVMLQLQEQDRERNPDDYKEGTTLKKHKEFKASTAERYAE